MDKFQGYDEEQTVELDEAEIQRANSHSHFEAGTHIQNDAQRVYERFFDNFQLDDCHSDEQRAWLKERATKWRDLILTEYTAQLKRRGDFVPVNVAGPSNYDSNKQGKIADTNVKKSNESAEKIALFLMNTQDGVKNRRPLEVILEGLRNGKFHSEVITTKDPHAIEKLTAKLYCLEKNQDRMKEYNSYWKKNKTLVGFEGLTDEEAEAVDKKINESYEKKPFATYQLSNNRQSIKSVKKRVEELETHKEDTFEPVEFDGGEVVANKDIDRIQFLFDGKPEEGVRNILKRHGFRWAPNQGAWQRQWTLNAERSTKKVLKELEEMEDNDG